MSRPVFAPVVLDDPQFVIDQHTDLRWHRLHYRVLYADTDAAGIVYHANYFRFFEASRNAIVRTCGVSYREMSTQGLFCPVLDLGAIYHKPLFYDDQITVYCRPSRIELVRFVFDFIIQSEENGAITTVAHTTHVAVNQHRFPVAVPASVVDFFAQFGVTRAK